MLNWLISNYFPLEVNADSFRCYYVVVMVLSLFLNKTDISTSILKKELAVLVSFESLWDKKNLKHKAALDFK